MNSHQVLTDLASFYHQSPNHFDTSNIRAIEDQYHRMSVRQDSVITSAFEAGNWPHMYTYADADAFFKGPTTTRRPVKRARTHNRTPSASTTNSNGPASPFSATTSFPHIANTDYSPDSPAHSYYADQALFSKAPTDSTFVTAGYAPSAVVAHMPNARLAMNGGFPIDDYSENFPPAPEFAPSSRQSMSSGHDSPAPATPQSHHDYYDPRGSMSVAQQDYRQPNPGLQLYRSDSQAYQDELFNPTFANASNTAAKRAPDSYLSPHRNLVTERLQTANMARSASPTSAISRERSPFRSGSPLAPVPDWGSTGQVRTAAGMRQQQKEEAEQAEYAQHVPNLQREPKTISPKDALLEYNDNDQHQQPLFQDQIPAGYRQHTNGGSEEAWQTAFVSQPGSSFGALTTSATPNDTVWPEAANFSQYGQYMNLPPQHQPENQIQGTPFHNNAYAAPRMDYSDPTPEFPAQLTSMESSISESVPPLSSQSSFHTSMPMQRPADTRANTGTYTCTYHGCTERFETHLGLQKHKRDYHRSQQHKESVSTPSGTDSASPRSTESPAPSGSGMTSAAILARNSQAGPHKCTRINPSTNKPCNVIFSRPYDLTRHEDTIHNNRKQKVRCPMCREEKTFSRNDALTRHMRVVHPEVESYGKRSRRGD